MNSTLFPSTSGEVSQGNQQSVSPSGISPLKAAFALSLNQLIFCGDNQGVTLETLKRYVEGQKNR